MPRSAVVLALAVALLVAPGSAFGAHAAAVVRLGGEPVATADPGTVVRRALVVENTGESAFEVRVDVVAPEPIELVPGPTTQRVEPGDWAAVPLTLRVAPSAQPRTFSVLYAVHTIDGQATRFVADGELTVHVTELAGVRLDIASTPAFAPAGASFPVEVRLDNTGNTPLDLTLGVKSSAGSLAGAGAAGDRVALPPGESRAVDLVLAAPASLPASTVDRIEVTASGPDGEPVARSAAYVELIPTRDAGDSLARYPLTIATTGTATFGDGTSTLGLLASAFGSSTIGFADDYRLDFELTKAVESPGALADPDPRDRAYVGFTGPAVSIGAGHATRSVSPLVLPQRETFGLDAQVAAGAWHVGGSIQQFGPADRETALASARLGYGSQTYGAQASLTTTTSRPAGETTPPEQTQPLHLSLLQSVALDRFEATVEAAGNVAGGATIGASALSASARIDTGGFDLAMSGAVVGPGFDAQTDDRYTASVNASVLPPVPGMTIDAAVALEQRGLSLPPSAEDRAFRREASAGVEQQLGAVGLEVGVVSRAEGDRLFGAAAETTDRLRAAATAGGRVWSAELSGSFSSTTAYPGPERTYGASAAASASFAAPHGAEVDVAASHTRTDLEAGREASTSSLDAGVSAEAGLLTLGARAGWTVPGLDPARSLLELSGEAGARLGPAGLLAATVDLSHDSTATDGGQWELGVSLAYATSLEVPYARDPSVGAVEGRVVDATTGEPAAGAVVRVGDAVTIADERGEWRLSAVAPGEYRVAVDPSTVPDGRIVAEEGATVNVAARSTARTDLELVDGGNLVGSVVVVSPTLAGLVDGGFAERVSRDWKSVVESGLARSAPAAGRTVTITNGSLTRSVRTDAAGFFRFDRLEPGAWYLSVSGDGGERELVASERAIATLASAGDAAGRYPGSVRVDLGGGERGEIELAEIVRRAPAAVQGGGVLSLP